MTKRKRIIHRLLSTKFIMVVRKITVYRVKKKSYKVYNGCYISTDEFNIKMLISLGGADGCSF